MARQYLEESVVWHIFLQICNGLRALHMHKILHRDIKTANILLTKDLRVHIADSRTRLTC